MNDVQETGTYMSAHQRDDLQIVLPTLALVLADNPEQQDVRNFLPPVLLYHAKILTCHTILGLSSQSLGLQDATFAL